MASKTPCKNTLNAGAPGLNTPIGTVLYLLVSIAVLLFVQGCTFHRDTKILERSGNALPGKEQSAPLGAPVLGYSGFSGL